MSRKTWLALAVLLVVVLGGWLTSAFGPGSAVRTPLAPAPTDPASGLPWISPADLPPQAHDVLRRIDTGGPFRFDKDGSVFGNFEGLLPSAPRGYYKEYTVDTPGSPDRGARRIVTGDQDRLRYWTDDHYESFARIRR